MHNESGLQPVEYNVIIRMDPVEDITTGGIYIPTSKKERDEIAADEGTIIAVSPHAFSYAEWPDDAAPPKVGDRVLFAQHDGRLWERAGVKYRLCKDKSIIAVIVPPALAAAA